MCVLWLFGRLYGAQQTGGVVAINTRMCGRTRETANDLSAASDIRDMGDMTFLYAVQYNLTTQTRTNKRIARPRIRCLSLLNLRLLPLSFSPARWRLRAAC